MAAIQRSTATEREEASPTGMHASGASCNWWTHTPRFVRGEVGDRRRGRPAMQMKCAEALGKLVSKLCHGAAARSDRRARLDRRGGHRVGDLRRTGDAGRHREDLRLGHLSASESSAAASS